MTFILVANPMVRSRIYIVLFLVIKKRSGRRESPVTRKGDRKVGRAAYKEQLGITANVLAMKLKTESCLHVQYICRDRGTNNNENNSKRKYGLQKQSYIPVKL